MGLLRSKKNDSTSLANDGRSTGTSAAPQTQESDPPQAAPALRGSRSLLPSGQHRPIFLLVWDSAVFKAHWAIFIAEDAFAKKGKYVHVEGSPDKEFKLEIVRGWELEKTRRPPRSPIELGWCPADLVVDIPTQNSRLVKEQVPRDGIESLLASVPAPGKTLRSATTSTTSASKRKPELSDCQWWVTRCTNLLVEGNHLVPPQKGLNKGKDPRTILAEAPRH